MATAWLFAVLVATAAGDDPRPGVRAYYRQPTLHGDRVVFVSEGDLFAASIGGGQAVRLTTHPGAETHPEISPDGRRVAFVGHRDGVPDVYVMPTDGGPPERLTWDGAPVAVVGWTPSGEILIRSALARTLPGAELVRLTRTGARRRIPLDRAAEGAFDGDALFFTRPGRQRSRTKRYRGGTAQHIWRWDGDGEEATRLTDEREESHHPVVHDDRVYFVSDRDGTRNMWSMQPDGSDRRQHTGFVGLGVSSLAGHDGRFVMRVGADLYRWDEESDRAAVIDIRLVTDVDQRRRRWIDDPWPHLETARLSPDGSALALTIRGRAFVVPVGLGRIRGFTGPDAGRMREAAFLGDTGGLVAFGDGGAGEMNLYRLPPPAAGEIERATDFGPGFRSHLVPSPDGRRIAFVERDRTLRITDLSRRRTVTADRSRFGMFSDLAWSPGGRYLVYTGVESSFLRTIRLHDIRTGRTGRVSSDRRNSHSPQFSPTGELIYFFSDLELASKVPSPWGPYQPEPYFDARSRLVALPVTGPARSPFAPWDELHPKPTEGDEARPGAESDGSAREADRPEPDFSWAAPADRLIRIPMPAGNYSTLRVSEDRLFWLAHETPYGGKARLQTLEVRPRERSGPKPETITEELRGFGLSADGQKLLIRREKELAVVPAAPELPEDMGPHRVDLDRWRMPIDPAVEWRQMFHEAWRLERDYFYDPGLHGVDWARMRARYAPLVERVANREELNDLIAQMVSELSALHTFVFGGDFREEPYDLEPGSLGARTRRTEQGYVIEHIYVADPDRLSLRSPLSAPHVDVREGDVIVAVNGQSTLERTLAELLLGRAGRPVRLEIDRASRGEPRPFVVKAMPPDKARDLRYAEWEYTRRLRVEAASGGRIGYVHLRSMSTSDIGAWARQFQPVFDRAGLIIDVRNNRGGNIDSWILEKLLRKAWFYWQPRTGAPYANMQLAHRGHVAVLVNEWTASDGEAFAEGFRRLGLGKVYGVRTWGGEIWLSFDTGLADGGMASVAQYGVYGPEGAWLIEGHGVEPDVEVENPPRATFEGQDAQLDRAIEDLKKAIRQDPRPIPPAPPYPDKSRRNHEVPTTE